MCLSKLTPKVYCFLSQFCPRNTPAKKIGKVIVLYLIYFYTFCIPLYFLGTMGISQNKIVFGADTPSLGIYSSYSCVDKKSPESFLEKLFFKKIFPNKLLLIALFFIYCFFCPYILVFLTAYIGAYLLRLKISRYLLNEI